MTSSVPRPDTEAPTATSAALPAADPDLRDADEPADGPALGSYRRWADGTSTSTHLFFADDEFDLPCATAICGTCGPAGRYLTDALDREDPYGVWGDELLVDGVIVAARRGRGRPPKQPRPLLVVDEVPPPSHPVA